MKKFVALLLAVMMLMATSVVLADAPSVVPPTPVVKTETIAYIIPTADGTNGTQIKEDIAAGKTVADLFKEETVSQVNALVGESSVMHDSLNLLVIDAWTPEIGAQKVEFEFATQYKVGDTIAAVLCIFDADGVTEVLLTAEVLEEYVATISFPTDVIEKMQKANENVLVIVSQPIAE